MPTTERSPHLKTEKGSAIHSAVATFSYIGGRIGALELPPLAVEPLKLEARNTALKDTGKSVLVEGDEVIDSYGNKLEVSSTSEQVETQVEKS